MNRPVRKYALIVAGGNGSRMGSEIPKQFILLHAKPLLMYAMEAFYQIKDIQIILALPHKQMEYWKELCNKFSFNIPHILVEGGETRFHSVRNGLKKVSEGLVAIHDGVRPFISKEIIEHSFTIASEKGNAVAAVKLKDSLRELALTGATRNVNRNNYYLIQTPQTFDVGLIKEAYENATHYNFTDDAGVLEEVCKKEINIIDGDYKNIKITTEEDIKIAEVFLESLKRAGKISE